MIAAFALVALVLVIRLAVSGRAARRLVQRSKPVVLAAPVLQAIEKLAQAHGRKAPPIRRSAQVSSPAVVGALKPIILIPDHMATDGEDLRAALLHEMAHVVRHDYAVNLVSEVLTLPVCWHPALIGLKAGVARSRELACDAMAAAAMASPKTYAKCLLSLAQTLGGSDTHPNAALAVGLFGRSDLEDRLMHLMKPKDNEGPAVRAARLCGLAAVGASLLGSAALLHVTPVFAQAAVQSATPPAPVSAMQLAPPPAAATAAIDQAQHDAAKPAHRRGLIFSQKGVIIEAGDAGYRHSFTGSDGQTITIVSDDAKDLTPEQQRQWEIAVRDGEAKAAAAEKLVNSPEFKAKIERAKAQAAAAQAMVNSPEFKAKIAAAEKAGADAEKMVNSPEFKARIAAAEKAGADAAAMVNSPEFKARIAKAAEAAAQVNSSEFQDRMARMQRRLDDLYRDDPPVTPNSLIGVRVRPAPQ